ncbi:MAG: bluetail domain-containing putative surface protein, partial [Cyanobacteriota bacterium]
DSFLLPYWGQPSGGSGSGLDQVIGWIARDPGLAGNSEASAIAEGITAADALNQLLITGLQAIGSLDDVVLDSDDVRRLSEWLRADAARESSFKTFYGDDENGVSTGFHAIQNDGANQQFRGPNLVDTILDGIYHFGFDINANHQFVNEDGNANAAIVDVASWLTALKTDLATTNTNLDRATEFIISDQGLAATIGWPQMAAGATAANNLNGLILEGLEALQASGEADADPSRIRAADVRWISQWIKTDSSRRDFFITNHGDDENGVETGFHLVQNNGGNGALFGKNLVNTVLDGIYHIGFEINADNRFQNEDGAANAKVSDVADWLTYFYSDPSTSGTGLDRIVDTIKLDRGLSKNTSAADINSGAEAANGLNLLILRALAGTGVYGDHWVTRSDLLAINQWIQAYEYPLFLQLHGDDENGVETGFHLVQSDGAETQYFGSNLINTVADGIYHIGFMIDGDNFENEDGDTNASLSDVSAWLNYFIGSRRVTFATWNADVFIGNDEGEQVVAYGGNDSIFAAGGDDFLDGGWGCDSLLGGEGDDILEGSYDNDLLDGGTGSDIYEVSGAGPEWVSGVPYTFQGYDTYSDTGAAGEIDSLVATGSGAVDIGLTKFGSSSGIEQIVNGTSGGAQVRLLGDWYGSVLDFGGVSFVGGNFVLDGGEGNDTVLGGALSDRLRGGVGCDVLTGGAGDDRYDYTIVKESQWFGYGSVEKITDFVVGADMFDVATVPAAIKVVGSTTALTTSAIGALLSSTVFLANDVASFSSTTNGITRSFVAFNDGVAGFSSSTDGLVEITGYTYATGFSSLSQIALV